MTETTVAIQTSNAPTNKTVAAAGRAAAIGALIAAGLAGYGNDALREVLLEVAPKLADKPATLNLLVFLVVLVLGYVGASKSGRDAAYNVLDAPNKPLPIEAAPKQPPLIQPTEGTT